MQEHRKAHTQDARKREAIWMGEGEAKDVDALKKAWGLRSRAEVVKKLIAQAPAPKPKRGRK